MTESTRIIMSIFICIAFLMVSEAVAVYAAAFGGAGWEPDTVYRGALVKGCTRIRYYAPTGLGLGDYRVEVSWYLGRKPFDHYTNLPNGDRDFKFSSDGRILGGGPVWYWDSGGFTFKITWTAWFDFDMYASGYPGDYPLAVRDMLDYWNYPHGYAVAYLHVLSNGGGL